MEVIGPCVGLQERLDDMFAKLVALQSEMGDTLKLGDFEFAPQ